MAKDAVLANQLALVSDRKISPFDAFKPKDLLKILGASILRGRFDTVKPFLATGKRMGEFGAEVKKRKQMLEALGPGPN